MTLFEKTASTSLPRRLPQERALDAATYELFDVPLVGKGRARRVDLEQLARELGLVDPFESVQARWRS